jgi:hypothetical protein
MYTNDSDVPVRRLQLDKGSGSLKAAPHKELFLRGPIPIRWLSSAAELPGKAINLALALWWLRGMTKGKPFKLRGDAVRLFQVSRDATAAGLVRLEQAGLIQVERKPGQRPIVSILDLTRR